MKILLLGGTGYLGRHLAPRLLAAGHQVCSLQRGRMPTPALPGLTLLQGDRNLGAAGLQALAGQRFDVCVDFSAYTPAQVKASADGLRMQIGHYVLISAARAYAEAVYRPVDEQHPLQRPAADDDTEINDLSYGRLKVRCEAIVRAVFGDSACTVLRPQVVTGPGDPSARLAWWVHRASQAGPMISPGNGADHLQMIDVRDVATFVHRVIEQGLVGTYNLAGPRVSWRQFVDLLGVATPIQVPTFVLDDAGLAIGELPLFRAEHSRLAHLMDLSAERALAAGLTLTPLADTVAAVRADLLAGRCPRGAPYMLSEERETALFRQTFAQWR